MRTLAQRCVFSRLLFVFKFFAFEKANQRGQHINLHIAKDQKEMMITSDDIYCDSHFPCTKEHENQPTMPFAYS
jgi:hypothetical protein